MSSRVSGPIKSDCRAAADDLGSHLRPAKVGRRAFLACFWYRVGAVVSSWLRVRPRSSGGGGVC
eukprot:9373253-Pyramimonas_sp.AAC.1